MYQHYLYIAIGGALGAVTRVGLSNIMPTFIGGVPFPIMAVNILGCFMIGLLAETMALYWSAPDFVRYLLIPGFLGGFTTFSSFALEFGNLLEKDNYISAVAYLTFSVGLSLLAFMIALRLVRML